MDGGLTGLHTMMCEARAAAEREASGILSAASAAGRDLLTDSENRLFRTAIETRDQLTVRIDETAAEIARCGLDSPVVAMLRNAGSTPPPLSAMFGEPELRALHAACTSRQSLRVESRTTGTPTGLLPATLWPSVLGPQHEGRLLDRLPTATTESGSVEYIAHLSTTGSPAVTAEGQPKSELQFVLDRLTATVQKLACHIGVSWEALSDFGAFQSYVTTEIFRQVIDVENAFLLSGDGPTTGLLNTPNVLPYHVGLGETALDALESAIADLRTGPSLATADIIVMHPGSWSAIRRSKDLQDRYLTQADPTRGEASSVWGCPVMVTTQIARGTALLLDSSKFGRVHIRQPLSLQVGYSGTDLIDNITRFVAEERLALTVERPSAALVIDGLPTGINGC